jgi:hypothetical protein
MRWLVLLAQMGRRVLTETTEQMVLTALSVQMVQMESKALTVQRARKA